MFFILSKVVSFVANPLFYIALLLFCSIIPAFKRKQGVLIKMAIGLFFFFGNNAISEWAMASYESDAFNLKKGRQYKYAVILGGYTDLEKHPLDRVHTNASVGRLLNSLPLLQSGQVNKLVLTGGNANILNREGTEAAAVAKLLKTFSVPDSLLIFEDSSKNTYENAIYSLKKLEGDGFDIEQDSIVLVSSAFHLPRAEAIFKKANYKFVSFATDFKTNSAQHWLNVLNFIPSTDAFYRWNILFHEWIGFCVYKMKGYC